MYVHRDWTAPTRQPWSNEFIFQRTMKRKTQEKGESFFNHIVTRYSV